MQGEEESMRQYMAQFSKATLNIPDLHQTVAMDALLIGLRSRKFLNILYTDLPANMDEIRSRVA